MNMNVTRNVIADLWPLYVAGEASAETRALVEAFLQADPEFARSLQEKDIEQLLKGEAPRVSPDGEAQALKRTKRLLHGWDWMLQLAILFSCFAFGRIVSDTSWDVSPRNFIITASIAACFWIAFFARTIWVRRKIYRTTIKVTMPVV